MTYVWRIVRAVASLTPFAASTHSLAAPTDRAAQVSASNPAELSFNFTKPFYSHGAKFHMVDGVASYDSGKFMFDDKTLRIYIDGVLVCSGSALEQKGKVDEISLEPESGFVCTTDITQPGKYSIMATFVTKSGKEVQVSSDVDLSNANIAPLIGPDLGPVWCIFISRDKITARKPPIGRCHMS